MVVELGKVRSFDQTVQEMKRAVGEVMRSAVTKGSSALVAKVNLENLSEAPVFPRETGNRTLVDGKYDNTATDVCQPDEWDSCPN